MPKEKQSQICRLRSLVSKFEGNVLSADGRILFCKVRELKVKYDRRSGVPQHIKTEKHAKI